MSTATSSDPTAADLWRSARGPLAVLAVVLLGGIVLALTTSGGSARLDPRSPAPAGGRALAEVLRDQGVQVDLVTTTAALLGGGEPGSTHPARPAAAGDTVLVTDPDLLAAEQVGQVLGTGADLVVLGAVDAGRWLPGVLAAGSPTGVRGPGCDLAAARRAGDADAGPIGYAVEGPGPGLTDVRQCYARDGVPSLLQAARDGRTVTLLGGARALTNDRLDDEGDAALALGLLGGRPRLIWYLPAAGDLPPGAATTLFYDLVPTGVWWGLGQLLVAVLLVALWRARRLGGVVTEPLPVVVRAAETVEGRARLYRRAGARDRAADSLRAGALGRLVPAMGLPRAAGPNAVVTAVARRSSRDEVGVASLLYGAAPAEDGALVRLADDLDALEREVRRP